MKTRSVMRRPLAAALFCGIAALAAGEERPEGREGPEGPEGEERKDVAEEFGNSTYRLGPEDIIDVFVWKEPELSTSVVVRPDGFISLPLANEMQAGGKTVEELQREIREKLSEFVAEPVVSVILKEIRSPRITVLGEVRTPNVYRIGQKSSVFDAIAMAGGFTEFAGKNEVTVIREGRMGPRRIRLDLRELVNGNGDVFYLRPSDTVYVP